MVRELHLRATVQPGGKIEVASPELTAGEDVDVTISPAKKPGESGKRSIVDILAEAPGQPHSAWGIISQAPGHLVFKSAEEVDEYIREDTILRFIVDPRCEGRGDFSGVRKRVGSVLVTLS